MKKKLINYDVFERIEEDSLSSAEVELAEAAPILAKALQLNCAQLHCFGPNDVLYETCDGNYIHANYQVKNNHIEFDNVEELVLNEETEYKKQREIVAQMLDALMEDKEEKANQLFSEYLALPRTRRTFIERKEERAIEIPKGGVLGKIAKKKKKKKPCGPFSCKENVLQSWGQICQHVFEYIDYKEHGPVINESRVRYDERGNPVGVRVPTTRLRNEMKLLSFDWKTLNTDCVCKRMNAKTLSEDAQFAQAVAELKRHNALSDDNSLQETLENIIGKWPQVIYLTQDELSESIKSALEMAGASNYDDQMCDFMAEGILRTAHHTFVDRVAKVMKLAGARVDENAEDPYLVFKNVVDQFYPSLDENVTLEMQVFIDLYEALRHVHTLATEQKNAPLRAEAAMHLNELLPIVQQEVEPTLEVAESAAEWLWTLVETNLETKDWNVSNTPHITVSGDHPAMADKARQKYSPAADASGDWGDVAPASDGASYKGGEADLMRNRAYGNLGGPDVFPALNNPYVPTPFGDYKIKGEKAIETDSDQLAHWGGSDTWPALQNPYCPAAVTPQTYKMNHGKEPDLVVDQ